jgi:hypothetical protein
LKNTVENSRYLPEGSRPSGLQCFHCQQFGHLRRECPKLAEVPKWPRFDVPVPNVEPTTEGKEVGLSHLDATGLELLLEIEIEGKCHLVLVDSGASLSVMKPGISSSELQPTQPPKGSQAIS